MVFFGRRGRGPPKYLLRNLFGFPPFFFFFFFFFFFVVEVEKRRRRRRRKRRRKKKWWGECKKNNKTKKRRIVGQKIATKNSALFYRYELFLLNLCWGCSPVRPTHFNVGLLLVFVGVCWEENLFFGGGEKKKMKKQILLNFFFFKKII